MGFPEWAGSDYEKEASLNIFSVQLSYNIEVSLAHTQSHLLSLSIIMDFILKDSIAEFFV